MQLHLRFSGSIRLSMAHRHFIQSLIYHALESDPAYSAALHNGSEDAVGRQFKLFTFGQLEGSYTIEGQHIHFPQGAGLEIRSIHEDLLFRLFRAFTVGSQIRIGRNSLTIEECTLQNSLIQQDALCIRTCSPIVAYITESDGHTRFFSPEDSQFYSLITANARRKWQMAYSCEPPAAFSIEPLPNPAFRKQVTMYKTTRITAWHGQFRLSGDPAMLNLLYHTGLGAKSSQGFGMFSPK